MSKHTSIEASAPCEPINIVPVNPLISKCQIKVCYVGDTPNRNKSVITKEVAKEMANSLPGSPIVGFYNEEEKDFEEHNRELDIKDGNLTFKDTTRPYGFVDLNARCWFQKFLDDGVEHEYLMTEGYLWTGQYPEAKRVIDQGNNQSMELDEKTIQAHWVKDSNGQQQFFIINEAIFSKLCILGEDFEPCFEGASITEAKVNFSLGEDFKNELFSLVKEMQQILHEGGTLKMPEENIQSPEEVIEEQPAVEEQDVEFKCGDKKEKKYSENEEKKDTEDKSDEDENDNTSEEEKSSEEDDEEEDKKKKKYSLDEITEYTELVEKYSALESKYNQLVEEKSSLDNEIGELRTFKLEVERNQKQDMIDNTFYMLSDEDKKDVVENIDKYSLDEIEAKLSIICVRNKVSFAALEEDEPKKASTTFNVDSIEDSDDVVPAWVKAALNTAKTL